MLCEKEAFVEKYLDRVKKSWLSAAEHFPEFLPAVSEEVKDENNKYIQTVAAELHKQLIAFPRLPYKRSSWRQDMLKLIYDLLFNENVIAIHKALDESSLTAFYEELTEFLRQERLFSPELRLDEIGQAVRNYIVYAMFKHIHRDDTPFNMAGFGYSMLYPFTDNYIDSKKHSPEEKRRYNRLIYDKLTGAAVTPVSRHQLKTCELLSAIENTYPRDSYPDLYSLLLMMLDAQELSLKQHATDSILSEDERLNISLYKGGVSVLIDRCLVRKPLNDKEIILYLGLGFFLQLADDLQDIGEDSRQGSQTLLTLHIAPEEREGIVNKLLHFIHDTLGSFKAENDIFKNFVLANCYRLIYTSVIGSREYFSYAYIRKLEQLLPVKTDYIQKLKENLYMPMDRKSDKKYLKMLDVLISNQSNNLRS